MSRQVNLGQIVPNIQIGTTTTSNPGTQASVTNVGTALNPILNFSIPKGDAGAIKMLIVAELPSTGAEDTIYLVPLETPDIQGNNYAEYVYINGAWELLGKIGVQVDLTDYVKFTDKPSTTTGGVIKIGTYGADIDNDGKLRANVYDNNAYPFVSNNAIISKGTLENVITGKGLVNNTNYANYSTGGVVRSEQFGFKMTQTGFPFADTITNANYQTANNATFISKGTLDNVLTAQIGNIQTLLDNLDTGSGV